jgi:hypothetical protein
MTDEKRTIKEQIEEKTKTNPLVEQGFVRLHSRQLFCTTIKSSAHHCEYSPLPPICHDSSTHHIDIHTHPNDQNSIVAIPSGSDISYFFDRRFKMSVIAQQNFLTGEVEGYTCIRRTRKTKWGILATSGILDLLGYLLGFRYSDKLLDKYTSVMHEKLNEEPESQDYLTPFRSLMKMFCLQYRFVPMKGYRLSKDGRYYEKIAGGKNED